MVIDNDRGVTVKLAQHRTKIEDDAEYGSIELLRAGESTAATLKVSRRFLYDAGQERYTSFILSAQQRRDLAAALLDGLD